MRAIDASLSLAFSAGLAMWLIAQRYSGEFWSLDGVSPALPAMFITGAGLCVLILRFQRPLFRPVLVWLLLLVVAEITWRTQSHHTGIFKPLAMWLREATPLLAGLGAVVWWRAYMNLRKAEAPPAT